MKTERLEQLKREVIDIYRPRIDNSHPDYKVHYEQIRDELIVLIDAELDRSIGCWYCSGIESHQIATVKTVMDEYCRELYAYDTPYNYCPNCSRDLRGDT